MKRSPTIKYNKHPLYRCFMLVNDGCIKPELSHQLHHQCCWITNHVCIVHAWANTLTSTERKHAHYHGSACSYHFGWMDGLCPRKVPKWLTIAMAANSPSEKIWKSMVSTSMTYPGTLWTWWRHPNGTFLNTSRVICSKCNAIYYEQYPILLYLLRWWDKVINTNIGLDT